MSEVFDNPFAIRPQAPRRPLVASLKGLLIVSALLVAVVVVQSQTRQWLLHRWASGFADLSVDAQLERLLQIDSLGDLAIETLTRRIAAADERVAAKAFELVREHQSAWSTRDDDALARAHSQMLGGLASIIDDLPPNRSGWVTQLLNQTIIECVDQRGEPMKQTYVSANELVSRLAGPGPNDLASAGRSVLPPPSLVPLPVRLQHLADNQATLAVRTVERSPVTIARPGSEIRIADVVPQQARNEQARNEQTGLEQTAHAHSAHRIATEPDQSPPRLLDSQPFAASTPDSLPSFETKRVIGLLASKQTTIRDAAVKELVRRGLSEEEIRIANQLAAPQVEVRLGLLESIVGRTDLDPRPWLLWLAEDSDREVRLRAVASLAAMNGAAVTQTLRKRLAVEADPAVIAQIHEVIQSR